MDQLEKADFAGCHVGREVGDDTGRGGRDVQPVVKKEGTLSIMANAWQDLNLWFGQDFVEKGPCTYREGEIPAQG